ncbi:MAG TPA: alpha-L-fucosidase [Gemmatimonadaceae bacterium]|nr:alpha-L-fucosidase [Gemmatimonadaceae bacterium]
MTVSRRGFVASLGAAGAGIVAAASPGASELLASSRVAGARSVPGGQPSARPRPSASQLLWQRDELALFLHFGVNTFTDREWGDGTESPQIFDPSALDARQWARTARAAGFKAMILTAKHHDGFCLWPTATTRHSVAASPFRDGRGDVVREFVDACAAEGLRAGVYLSPWDRNHPTYGDSPAYNDVYAAQLTELLTQYGPIHEVWHDGANGEGPNGKRQEYDWQRVWALVKRLQPEAVIFSDAGPDVRWIGNEIGVAGETNWSTVRPEIVPVPGLSGDEVMRSLQQGDRDGTVWRPGETDVSIRPGWFYHPAEDARVRSAENLEQLYFSSVGRNSKLLLNVPPTRAGLLHEADVRSLMGMRERLDARFARDVTTDATRRFRPAERRNASAEVLFPIAAAIHTIDLAEQIEEGQRVAAFTLEGYDGHSWITLHRGSTIGYRRLISIEPRNLAGLRVEITDAVEPPIPLRIRAFS